MPPASEDRAVAAESTELLRTLIRSACVNDGAAESGQEVRNVGSRVSRP